MTHPQNILASEDYAEALTEDLRAVLPQSWTVELRHVMAQTTRPVVLGCTVACHLESAPLGGLHLYPTVEHGQVVSWTARVMGTPPLGTWDTVEEALRELPARLTSRARLMQREAWGFAVMAGMLGDSLGDHSIHVKCRACRKRYDLHPACITCDPDGAAHHYAQEAP